MSAIVMSMKSEKIMKFFKFVINLASPPPPLTLLPAVHFLEQAFAGA